MAKKELIEYSGHPLWEPVTAYPGTCFHWQIGSWKIWIQRLNEEWDMAVISNGENDPGKIVAARPVKAPKNIEWARFISGTSEKIWLHPALPDKSVVVRSDQPLKILPGKGSRFYFLVPVWIAVKTGPETRTRLLAEYPLVNMKSTWFGDPTAGELSYALDTPLHRELYDPIYPYMALCPVNIRNASSVLLDFQRICIRVQNLKLFQYSGRLYTNEILVNFKGVDQSSQITYQPEPPSVYGKMQLLTPPREPVNRNILKKSFYFLKYLTDY